MAARDDQSADQAPLIGRTIHQKLEELRQLDARIEKRMEHLSRTEQNLRLLFDSLRSQVLQAHPLIGQLNQLRQSNTEMIESLVEQVRQRLGAATEQIAPATLVSVDTSLAQSQIESSARQASEAIDARVRQVDQHLHSTVESARNYLDQAFEAARASAQQTLEAVQGKLDELRASMVEAQALRESSPVERALGNAEQGLDEMIATFGAQVDATLSAMRRSVSQQVEQLSQQAKLEIRPLLARIEEQHHASAAQLSAATESAEAALSRRADELRRNAERMVELVERQIIDRLATTRPRLSASLEAMEQSAARRITQSMDEMSQSIASTEQRLVERLESLRPRAAELAMQLEQDLRDQIKRLESDAVASIHWLEHRLERRVEELTDRLARALDGQIASVDERLVEPEKTRPESPVQVQVMVDSPNRRPAAA